MKKISLIKQVKWSYHRLMSSGLFVFILTIYLLTLAPTIGFRDSGDMVTASYVLGVSHPSGFPLYMLLGKFFSFLPLGNIAVRYNFMSAVFAALAAFFVFLSVRKITGNQVAGAAAAFLLAFSVTFWSYAVFAEKYTLYAFFAAVLTYTALKFSKKKIPVFAFLLGLGLTHHLSLIVFILPFLYLVRTEKYAFEDWWKPIGAFLLPLLLYAYLPLSAGSSAPLKWSNPDTLEKILNHISAREYRYAMFSAEKINPAGRLVTQLWTNFAGEFSPAGYLLALIGLFYLYRVKLSVFLFLAGVLACNAIIFINYNIIDPQNIATYYFSSFVVFAVCAGTGIQQILEWAGNKYRAFLLTGFGIFAFSFFPLNYRTADMSLYTADRDFGRNIIRSVEDGALVITNGDLPIFSLWYCRYAEGAGKKIEIIPGNREKLKDVIDRNYGKRPVYLNYYPYETAAWENYDIIPRGMMYLPVKKKTAVQYDKGEADLLWETYEGVEKAVLLKNAPGYERQKMALDHYAFALTAQGEFFAANGFNADALKMFERTLRIYPEYMEALIGTGKVAEKAKRLPLAKKYYDRVLFLNGELAGRDFAASKLKLELLLMCKAEALSKAGMYNRAGYLLKKKERLENNK